LIDWGGEFNSYLVPFSAFGLATVSRSPEPALIQYLYDLSKSDGADQSRIGYGDPSRNGEPYGELGLITQRDALWQSQHGGPRDPQPGNASGSKRDTVDVTLPTLVALP